MRYLFLILFTVSLNAQILPSQQATHYKKNSVSEPRAFNNCGKTGYDGPSQSDCNTAYASSDLNGEVTVTSGIQYWTVPVTATYTITVYGAQGGRKSGGLHTKGAKMKGDFNLTSGTVLKILVGQAGVWGPDYGNISCGSSNDAGSGGGGTFVAKQDNTPLIVAGGGGGYNKTDNSVSTNAVVTLNGVTPPHSYGSTQYAGAGGINGGGGGAAHRGTAGTQVANGGSGAGCAWGPGGGGFYTNGGENCSGSYVNTAGLSFLNGGRGGIGDLSGCMVTHGGFGGGASAGHRSGGGGGWSGGGGGASGYVVGSLGGGGGAGSYNSGSNQNNEAASREGSGQVDISW